MRHSAAVLWRAYQFLDHFFRRSELEIVHTGILERLDTLQHLQYIANQRAQHRRLPFSTAFEKSRCSTQYRAQEQVQCIDSQQAANSTAVIAKALPQQHVW